MSGSAGFHTDQASRNLAKEFDDLLAPQLTGDEDLAHTIHAVHLEHVLGEINADDANLHWTIPSGDSLFNDHPLAHLMPGAGVVHHIMSDVERSRYAAELISLKPDVLLASSGAVVSALQRVTRCMVRPCVARGFVKAGVSSLASMYPVVGASALAIMDISAHEIS
jgi:hypothetical protein